ncbi:helix-turn-helix domain-containing protein [Magnetococcus sp. PR-3]|uniref:helix-turn-helix domain-containing protein n=1 Tax=Magnetococcus sp. PR-3 TaxID=3120355 RepID=UPI002FCE4957
MSFAERFDRALSHTGITQTHIAHELGIKPAAVSQWKTGGNGPKFTHLCQLAKILGVSLDWLVCGQGEMGHEPEGRYRPEEQMPLLPILQANQVTDWLKNRESIQAPWQRMTHEDLQTLGAGTFIMVVHVDVMAPRLQPGDQAIFDPTQPPKHNDITLVSKKGSDGLTLRRFLDDGISHYLCADDSRYIKESVDAWDFRGTMRAFHGK